MKISISVMTAISLFAMAILGPVMAMNVGGADAEILCGGIKENRCDGDMYMKEVFLVQLQVVILWEYIIRLNVRLSALSAIQMNTVTAVISIIILMILIPYIFAHIPILKLMYRELCALIQMLDSLFRAPYPPS